MFNLKDNSVLNIEPGFDYQRVAVTITIAEASMTSGANIGNNKVPLDMDYSEVVGIAVYDRSAGTQAFSLAVRDDKGKIFQDLTGRKSWVYTGTGNTDVALPETSHYKLIRTDYSKTGAQNLIFNVANLTASTFTEDVVLDVVVMCRRPSAQGVINN